MKSELVP